MAKKKYYGVKQGWKIGVFTSWAECERQVKGYKGALFQGFATEVEARTFVYGVAAVISPAVPKIKKNTSVAVTPDTRRIKGKHYDVYVDGSYQHHRLQYSWGFAVYDVSNVIYTASGVDNHAVAVQTRNIAGELLATINAVAWAEDAGAGSITIHHDYAGIAHWAQGEWKTNHVLTQQYAKFMKPYLQWVFFNKVKGHSGVAGNELADRLASEAFAKAEKLAD